jgi:CHAT domain-containing protein
LLRRIERGEDVEPENYLDVAVTQWLPQRWSRPECNRALESLAMTFGERHGDRWLHDVLAAKQSANMLTGLQALSGAVRANLEDQSDLALSTAVDASHLLRIAGGTAAALRAEYEQVYALHRSVRSAEPCLKKAAELDHQAGAAKYSWIQGQAVLEQGNCRSLLGDSGGALNDMERALTLARQADYRDLALRAESILTEARTTTGNLLTAWEVGREASAEFWTGAHSGLRGQQIFLNLAQSADGLGLSQTAYVLEKAAAAALTGTPRRRTEAGNRAYLAELAAKAGWTREAETEFGRAGGLLDQIPQQGAGEYRTLAELYRAQAEIAAGTPGAALKRLEAIRPSAEHLDAVAARISFRETYGDVLRRNGRPADAEAAYWRAIQLSEHGLRTLKGYLNRSRFILASANAYRGLAGLLWDRGDSAGALRIWEWFRTAESPDPRSQPDLDRRLPGVHKESFLTFAELPGGFVAWVYDDRGITGRRLTVRSQDLEIVTARFLRECADRESDQRAIQRDARQLYDWLLAPLAEHLDPSRTLVIEPDGVLGAIPVQALMDPDLHYAGERFAVTVAASLADYQRRAAAASVQSNAHALVVADPWLGGEMTKAFPPLPGTLREGRSVAGQFANSVLLSGREATLSAVEQHRPRAEVFHFAGHGFSNAGNGGLLLSPVGAIGGGAAVLGGTAMAQQDWGRCRLAVLSACSTGTGEARGPVNPESLVRGLLWAGVARVVASRWNMDTQAGVPFMDSFYASLLSGEDTAAALQHAAQRLRQDGATSHPYYWAGFQSFGAR